MATFDFEDYLDDGSLKLEGVKSKAHPKGTTYVVPAPDAKTGLWISALADLGIRVHAGVIPEEAEAAKLAERLNLDDAEELDFYERILTREVWAQMTDDGVPFPNMQVLGKYAFLHFGVGPGEAEASLRSGRLTGAIVPNRQARRAAAKKAVDLSSKKPANSRRASQPGDRKTQKPASTAGTTSPRKRPAKA